MAPCLAASLRTCLEGVSDPRSTHARRHPFTSILFLALTAVIGGADTWVSGIQVATTAAAGLVATGRVPSTIP